MFPAYAGVIPGNPGTDMMKFSVPRVRGGDPDREDILEMMGTCSPRMRG